MIAPVYAHRGGLRPRPRGLGPRFICEAPSHTTNILSTTFFPTTGGIAQISIYRCSDVYCRTVIIVPARKLKNVSPRIWEFLGKRGSGARAPVAPMEIRYCRRRYNPLRMRYFLISLPDTIDDSKKRVRIEDKQVEILSLVYLKD